MGTEAYRPDDPWPHAVGRWVPRRLFELARERGLQDLEVKCAMLEVRGWGGGLDGSGASHSASATPPSSCSTSSLPPPPPRCTPQVYRERNNTEQLLNLLDFPRSRLASLRAAIWRPAPTHEALAELLLSGAQQRNTDRTAGNSRSSRSHAIFMVEVGGGGWVGVFGAGSGGSGIVGAAPRARAPLVRRPPPARCPASGSRRRASSRSRRG